MTERTCTVDGCSRRHHAKGLCTMHLRRLQKHGDVHWEQTRPPESPGTRRCSVPGCELKHKGRGFCQKHLIAHKAALGENVCTIAGCERGAVGKGLCTKHYQRMQATGKTDEPVRLTAEERTARQRENERRYKDRNREVLRARARARYAADPEKERARNRRYQAENRERLNEACRQWHVANRERVMQRLADWYANNPVQARAIWQAKRARRLQQIRNTQTEPINFRALLAEHGMHCHICDRPIPGLNDLHFDHVIPLARGGTHTADNIRPSHAACNLRKGAKILGSPNGKRLLAAAPSDSGPGADEHVGHVVVRRR